MHKFAGVVAETFLLGCAALAALLGAIAVVALRAHFDTQNPRVLYGLQHLPAALHSICLSMVIVGVAWAVLSRTPRLAERPVWQFVLALSIAFCLCWLPAWLAGGFVQDDWQLLFAASVRKSLYLHPWYSWNALDTVDGNFRPLGTVLYVGYMLKLFGLSARALTAGTFIVNLLGSLTAFAIVRRLGYPSLAGAAAALLYMTRPEIYTIVTWMSALGDGFVILLCGLMTLALLAALERRGGRACGYHLLAWLLFALATLAKQSSFVVPLIAGLLLYLRPGASSAIVSRSRRIGSALAVVLVYGATAAISFHHAKTLLHRDSPYPIGLTSGALLHLFNFVISYLVIPILPSYVIGADLLSWLPGVPVVLLLVILLYKIPALRGERPRDLLFALLASVASISIFALLQTRGMAYYGCMSAFWLSIALGVMLTRFASSPTSPSARRCAWILCLLLLTGYAANRIAQTGLIAAGGYIWGTYGMDTERELFAGMQQKLAGTSHGDVVVLAQPSPFFAHYPPMAMLAAPTGDRLLLENTSTGAYFANSMEGRSPMDAPAAWNDLSAYFWTTPLDPAQTGVMLAQRPVHRLFFQRNLLLPTSP